MYIARFCLRSGEHRPGVVVPRPRMSTMRLLTSGVALFLSIPDARADCWVIPGARGEVLGWRCNNPPPAAPTLSDWTRLLPQAPTHYGPDLGEINTARESALRQQILREQLRQLQNQR